MNIRDYALSYLTKKSRSAQEVRLHLAEKGFDEGAIAEELSFLNDFHYLDDKGYCLRYVERSLERGRGFERIGRELREKGIDAGLVDGALLELGIEDKREFEKQRAARQAEQLAEGQPASGKLIGKIGRKLAAQGFDSDAIYHAVGKIMISLEANDGSC